MLVTALMFVWLYTGNLGQFDLLTVLLSLVSSITLLAVARNVVEFMAFSVLPLKFIYRQYRNITVRFASVG